jgi:cytochrome d ubiquinol oxidase subunit II
VALAGIFIVNADNHKLFHSLLTGRALPAVIVSALAGLATLALVYGHRFEPARYCAALAVLFRLAVSGRFREDESGPVEHLTRQPRGVRIRVLARLAVACLIAGFGLLNLADAQWAHAVGIVCLFAFILTAFRAIIHAALDEQPATSQL